MAYAIYIRVHVWVCNLQKVNINKRTLYGKKKYSVCLRKLANTKQGRQGRYVTFCRHCITTVATNKQKQVLFFTAGRVNVNNIKMSSVAMEMQKCFPLALVVQLQDISHCC